MTYEVKLDVFQGPLDLLLQLITRQRVDIYEVSIATITDEYLRVLDEMSGVDLETATGFLVVAATLLELKSARLLPSVSWNEDDEKMLEERDLLLARLVECATYRDAGVWLAAGLAAGGDYHGRAVTLEPQLTVAAPDLLAHTSVADIVRAAEIALAPKPVMELDTSHVQPIRASVKDALIEVSARLREGPADFRDLCGGLITRIDVVVRFLALLELFKAGAVDLSQGGRFGEIHARWTGDAEELEVIAEIDEYALGPEV